MRLRSAAAAVTIALIATACAAEGSGRVDGGQTVEEATATGPSADAGQDGSQREETAAAATIDDETGSDPAEALWWTAETVADGSEFAAADLTGEDVVLWLWAPWCSVCNREAPDVAEALGDLPDDVTVIGVAGRDDVGPMQDFVAEHGLHEMTHVVDADGAIWASYGISYQPAWVFIDAEGNATVNAGMLGYDGILATVDEVFGT